MQKKGGGSGTRIYDKFEGYSLEDCACEFCIHYKGKSKPCGQDVCCCAEEKAEALLREVAGENRLAAASVGAVISASVKASSSKSLGREWEGGSWRGLKKSRLM